MIFEQVAIALQGMSSANRLYFLFGAFVFGVAIFLLASWATRNDYPKK